MIQEAFMHFLCQTDLHPVVKEVWAAFVDSVNISQWLFFLFSLSHDLFARQIEGNVLLYTVFVLV